MTTSNNQLIVNYSERRNHAYATDGVSLYKFIDGEFKIQTRQAHELKNQIDGIINGLKSVKFNDNQSAIDWVIKQMNEASVARNETRLRNEAIRADFEANLSEFWKDVDGRTGMDVTTPFKNKLKTLSFVAYDAGFVWCKDTKTAYLLRNFKSIAYLPKSYKSTVRFGEEF